uniref:Uncharacterized protein n=1 Tax=Tanacetum cinerariifolium TaxID=118510 RepID=A0A699GGX2_TANCI|nr:hypothetical protein [Tanacetum cinerariifolium]
MVVVANKAQSSRVPIPLHEDPYEAIREAYLDGTDTESEPFEDSVETETPDSPHTVAPPTCCVEESRGSGTSGARSTSSDSTVPLSPDHPLTHTTHVLAPSLRKTARMAVRCLLAMSPGLFASIAEVAAMFDSEFYERFRSSYDSSPSSSFPGKGPTIEDEDPATRDDGLSVGDEGPSIGVESLGLGGEEAVPEGQQRAASVVKTAMSEPLGLGHEAMRRQEIALGEGQMPSVFEVGQSSGQVSERPKRVSALRQPTLTTWIDPKDRIAYIDVPAYPPPAPPVQTLPSPEWSSSSLPISPAPSIVPSPISSPMISLTVTSPVALPVTAEAEGFLTELKAQRYRFKSLEHEHKRTAMTFRVLWRPMLALKAWAVLHRELQERRCHVIILEQERDHREAIDDMRSVRRFNRKEIDREWSRRVLERVMSRIDLEKFKANNDEV